MRLKTKLIISHIILVLLLIVVLSGFLYLRICGIVMDDSIRSEQALSVQTATFIGDPISHVGRAPDTITNVMLIQDLFQVPKAKVNTMDISTSRTNSLFHLVQSITDYSVITGVKIYYDDSVYGNLMQYNKVKNALLNPVSLVSSSYWYGIYSTSDQARLLCLELYLIPDKTERNGRSAYTTRIPCTHDGGIVPGTRNISAYVTLYLSRSVFDMMLHNNATVTDRAAFPVNERNMIVSASGMGLAGEYLIPRPDLRQRVGEKKMLSPASYLGGSAYVAYLPVADTDWYIIFIIPALRIGDASRTLMMHFTLIYLPFTALALYTAFRPSSSIADRIIGVTLWMETVRTDPSQPMDVADTNYDEIGVPSGTYNYMTEEIITPMDNQKKASDRFRMTEFRALQAQINPRFLYSALDMISWLSQAGQDEKVTEAVQVLSRFYEFALSRKELINPIEKEPEHVSLYVRLQNTRYDNRAAFMVDVPEEIYEYAVPKLTFQSIVENAFLHSIMTKEGKKGSILLTGWPDEDDTVFIISGGGAGIPPETLDTLKDGVNVGTDSPANPRRAAFPGHINVYNTSLRLKNLYGGSYGLSFTSTLGEGTEVTARIPAKYITSD